MARKFRGTVQQTHTIMGSKCCTMYDKFIRDAAADENVLQCPCPWRQKIGSHPKSVYSGRVVHKVKKERAKLHDQNDSNFAGRTASMECASSKHALRSDWLKLG